MSEDPITTSGGIADEWIEEKGAAMFSTELEVETVSEHVPMVRRMDGHRFVEVRAFRPEPEIENGQPRVRSCTFLLPIDQQPRVGDRITVAITGALVATNQGGAE